MSSPRVVSLIASSTETVCALGCGDWLVGRSHECDHPEWIRRLPAVTRPTFECNGSSGAIHESVRAIVDQGLPVYHVDAEALAALRPDVILTQIQCEVCAVSLGDVTRALGEGVRGTPRLVALEPNRLTDLWRDMRRVADALGLPERGVQLVTRLERRMRALGERASALAPRPRVAFLEWIEPPMAAGNWTPELIALAGGDDLFGTPATRAPELDWDSLLASDPDVLWVAPCGFDLARTRAEMGALAGRPGFLDLRAAREGRVYLGDGNALFNRPGPRVVESLEALAESLHPAAFRFGHEGRGWERWAALPRA